MARTSLMTQLLRLARLADNCERTGQDAHDAIGQDGLRDRQRRRVMQGAMAGAATLASAAAARSYGTAAVEGAVALTRTTYARLTRTRGVAVIGAGLAGLACARELRRLGVDAKVYEAGARVGGRCSSARGVFPGQVAERGAEFIGASHHAMLGYAREFGLQLTDVSSLPGRDLFHFEGRAYGEAQVLEEFRQFVACIRADLEALSRPTAERFTEADRLFDFMSLDDYMLMYGAGGLLRGVVGAACAAEFGVGADALSAIAFLRFVYGDPRGKFAARGATSQFQAVEGVDRIATGLARTLAAPVQMQHRLLSVRRLSGGTVRLAFDVGGRVVQRDHDAVVLAVPFSVLREVELHASLELPDWKRLAIDASTMGDAAKLMVGFTMPVWYGRHESNGRVSSDMGRLQTTWETAPAAAGTRGAVLTHLAGGPLARTLRPQSVQSDARAFLGDLERTLPGAMAAARRTPTGELVALCENWSVNPLSRGAYPAPRPGYFTTIAHREATPIGNVMFAGDHTSSFYEWQGFMEGAALSGLRAADEAANFMLGR